MSKLNTLKNKFIEAFEAFYLPIKTRKYIHIASKDFSKVKEHANVFSFIKLAYFHLLFTITVIFMMSGIDTFNTICYIFNILVIYYGYINFKRTYMGSIIKSSNDGVNYGKTLTNQSKN